MPPNDITTFQPLTGVYEPSGIHQLADGRFLVVAERYAKGELNQIVK